MKKITYEPDLVLHSNQYNDKLEITIKEKSIVITAFIDGCGNDFKINKKELMKMLK